eukprot:scaffold8759_cov135-Isochrysis_galbana.AAC.9
MKEEKKHHMYLTFLDQKTITRPERRVFARLRLRLLDYDYGNERRELQRRVAGDATVRLLCVLRWISKQRGGHHLVGLVAVRRGWQGGHRGPQVSPSPGFSSRAQRAGRGSQKRDAGPAGCICISASVRAVQRAAPGNQDKEFVDIENEEMLLLLLRDGDGVGVFETCLT